MNSNTGKSLTESRLHQPPDELNQKYILAPLVSAELPLLPIFLEVDKAHAVMLVEQGILSPETGAPLLAALRDLSADPSALKIELANDTLVLQIEHHLASVAGTDAAGRLHTGRSRNDHGPTVDRIFIRDRLLGIAEGLGKFQQILVDRASSSIDTVMPGYTHLQHAQPTTFAHYLLRHGFCVERDQERLEQVVTRVNRNPLGLAAMTGTSWPLDQQRTAKLLGFDGLVRNAMDSGTFNNDVQVEVATLLALMTNNLARMAADFYLWSTYEFGMVEVSDGLAGTSSIMPQKKNPHSLERVLSIAGVAVGWPSSMLGATRGASSSDLGLAMAGRQLPAMLDMAEGAIALLAATLADLILNVDVMRERAGANWSTASNLADELVRFTGITFRDAHSVVGTLVATVIGDGRMPNEVTMGDLQAAVRAELGHELEVSEETLRISLDPAGYIQTRATVGTPRPDDVRAQISSLAELGQGHEKWVVSKRDVVREARGALAARVDELASPHS